MTQVLASHERERELYDAISATLGTALPDIEVLAVEMLGSDRFCVYIDHRDGVDHGLCTDVTTALGDYLAEFAIDVSSPGLERPLRSPTHFEAAAIRLARPNGRRRKFRGRIACVSESHVSLELADGEAEIAYDDIARANLIDEEGST